MWRARRAGIILVLLGLTALVLPSATQARPGGGQSFGGSRSGSSSGSRSSSSSSSSSSGGSRSSSSSSSSSGGSSRPSSSSGSSSGVYIPPSSSSGDYSGSSAGSGDSGGSAAGGFFVLLVGFCIILGIIALVGMVRWRWEIVPVVLGGGVVGLLYKTFAG